MARYNEILVGRLNRALQKFLSMKGEAPAPQVASEFMSVLPMQIGAEFRYLEGWYRYSANLNQAAVAAQQSICQIRNPAKSGVIAVCEKFIVAVGVADPVPAASGFNVRITADQTTIPGATTGLDQRQTSQSSVIRSRGSSAAPPGVVLGGFGALLANQPFDFITTPGQEIVIAPGDGLAFAGPVNAALSVTIIWRERPIEDSEVT